MAKSNLLPKLASTITNMTCIDQMGTLATATMDGNVSLIDLHVNRVHKVFSEHTKGVICLDFAKEYRYLLSGGIDHVIKVLQVQQVYTITLVDLESIH